MESVKRYLEKRYEDVEVLIAIAKLIENDHVQGIDSVKSSPVIKSSIIIALYNMVEFTVTGVLGVIHKRINEKNKNISNLKNELRDLLLIYSLKSYEKKSDVHSVIDILSRTINIFLERESFSLDFKDMTKNYSLYSGNLDGLEIRSVFKKYSIAIPEVKDGKPFGKDLHEIKKTRNYLAHGEYSFEEKGRRPINDIEKMIENTKEYLDYIIREAEQFILDEKYLVSYS